MIFTIQGMNCNHCRMNAEKALQAVEGVESASVDLDSKQARVVGTASFEALSQALDEIGFTAVK